MTAVAVPRLCPFCRLRPLQPWRDPYLHSCAVCAAQAVTRPEQLQSLAQWLLARIAQVTPWSLRRGSTRVRLLDPVAFEQRFGNGVAGLAQQWWLDGRLGRQHQRAEVFLQYGSPAARALWVLGHELGHVLVAQQGWTFAHAADEEGFCQTLAWALTAGSANPQMPEVRQQEWQRGDPVYGDGLRQGVHAVRQQGWMGYLRQLGLCLSI